MLTPNNLRRGIDVPLVLITYATTLFGILMLYSATLGDRVNYAKSQVIWLVIASVALIVGSLIDYNRYGRWTRHLYWLNIGLLVFVKLKGHGAKGAVRWIKFGAFQFQPSEFAKVGLIICLAYYLVQRRDEIRKFWGLVRSFFYIAIPAAIIVEQPDLGTGLVVMVVWLGMVFVAGAKGKHLAILLLSVSLLFGVAWRLNVIKDYQKMRVIVLFDPEADKDGAGYHVAQARIAIGSGGTWGKGYLKSQSVRGGFIPEKQTDFIYTTIGEELGFFGGLFVLFLYLILLWRGGTVIIAAYEDELGKLMATGIVTMLAFHIVVNVGMNIGIMPVTGVPLPLISAGGSNLILIFFAIGILQSIIKNRRDLIFG